MKRRGSLINEIKLQNDSVEYLRDFLNANNKPNFELSAVSLADSKVAQTVIVKLNINYPNT